jgi:hypothetical protein
LRWEHCGTSVAFAAGASRAERSFERIEQILYPAPKRSETRLHRENINKQSFLQGLINDCSQSSPDPRHSPGSDSSLLLHFKCQES